MDRRSIDRINALSRLAKERELTDEESRERAALRRAYLDAFRAETKRTLDNTRVQYPDGSVRPLKERERSD